MSLKNHHKTVTCLCLSSNGERLMSASLDRYMDTDRFTRVIDKSTESSNSVDDYEV